MKKIYSKKQDSTQINFIRSGYLWICCLSILLCGITHSAYATHVVGSDITYKCTGTPGIYEITLVVYRKCDGPVTPALLCTGGCGAPCVLDNANALKVLGADPSCSATTFASVPLTLVSVRDVNIDTDCPLSKNACTNMGCVGAGTYTPSVERYEFKAFVNVGPTSGIPASCCNVRFTWSLCCRNSDIGTGAADQSFYVDAIINRCHSVTPCNSSPTLTNDPFAIICGGDNYVFNNGAVDPDLDSLSYTFTSALQGFGSPVTYTPPFAFDRPMPWTGNAGTPFPAGIHCDPLNGDIMFTPPNAGGLFSGVMAVEIKQWKLINGVMTVVGITRRDIQMYVRGDCLPNNPPRLITNPPEDGNVNVPKTTWSICAGDQLCFTITAKDTDFNPPTVSDTTYLSWNAALASYGATFKPDYDPLKRRLPDTLGGGPREDRYQFCWTPDESRASTTPYYFTVSAKDKRCPNPGRVTRAFSVLVIGKANLKVNKTPLNCGKWGFSYTNLTPKFVPTTTQWQISRVPGDQSMSQNPYVFNNTSSPGSIQFYQGGRYYIQLKAVTPGPIGSPGCIKIITDSFDVDSVMLVQKRDTLVCSGNSVQLSVTPKHGIPVFTYRWWNSIRDTSTAPLNTNVNTSNFSVSTPVTRYYTVQIRDLNGCKAYDSVKVEAKSLPVGMLPSTARICYADTFTLDPGNNGGNIRSYLWNVGDTTQTIQKWDSGQYIVTIKDTFNCEQKDTMMLYVNRKVVPDLGADKAICEGESVTLKATGGQLYRWRNLTTGLIVQDTTASSDTLRVTPGNTTTPTRYEVRAYLSYPNVAAKDKECTNTDTISVKVNAKPRLNRPPVTQACMTDASVSLPSFFVDNTQFPNQGAGTGVWSYPANPSAIAGTMIQTSGLSNKPQKDTLGSFDNWVRYTFTGPAIYGSCVTVDSANIRVYGTPPTNAGKDFTRCDIAGVYELSKQHSYSPQDLPLRKGEVWVGPGIGSYLQGGVTYYTFNPTAAGVALLPAKNTVEYQYTHTYNAGGTNPISCYKADQVDIGVTQAPKVQVDRNIVVCTNEPLFLINDKTDESVTPSVGTSPYWEPADASIRPAFSNNWQSFSPSAALTASPMGVTAGNKAFKVYYKDTSTGCAVQDSISIVLARVPQVNLIYFDRVADSPYVCLGSGKEVRFRMYSTPFNSGTSQTEPAGNMVYSVTPASAASAFGMYSAGPANAHSFKTADASVTPGTYVLKMTHTNNQQAGSGYITGFAGCSASDSLEVIVQDPPKITVSSPSAICNYDAMANVSLSEIPKPDYGFMWVVESPADGSYGDSSQSSTTYIPGVADKASGIVTIKARSTKDLSLGGNGDQCAVAESSQPLNIYPAPAAVILPIDSEGCIPYTGNYAAGPTGVANATFAWSWNGTPDPDTDSLISKPVDYYESNIKGEYSLGLTVSSAYGSTVCSTTATPAMLLTHPLPRAKFEADPPYTTIAKPFFNFINLSSVSDGSNMSYLWNLGPGPDIRKPADRIVTVTNPTNIEYAADTAWQKVSLTVTTEYGCVDSTMDSIRIQPDITVFIPNAFRPNSKDGTKNSEVPCVDGVTENCNSVFRVVASGHLSIEVFIYNRWGQLVFKTTNANDGWNGTVMNQMQDFCPQDVYVYQVNATSFSGKAYRYSGSITLLR